MPVTINGNGSITGLAQGGIDGTKVVTSAAQPAGSIIQVLETRKTDASEYSIATQAFQNILSLAITPISSSSKIFCIVSVNATQSTSVAGFRILRGSTPIGVGDAAGNRRQVTSHYYGYSTSYSNGSHLQNSAGFFVDSPNTTSATTYNVEVTHGSVNTQTVWVNRMGGSDNDQAKVSRPCSSLTLMEIVG
tara:strand:- start:616 stop:1188 length:573 start_codon:yes stop_codon:yes gene_type:complete